MHETYEYDVQTLVTNSHARFQKLALCEHIGL